MGQRETNRRRTRQAVLEAAHRLFDQHGYDATTVEMIADDAGVARRTFFRYFESKDGVLAHVGFDLIESLVADLEEEPSVAGLVRTLAVAFDDSLQDPRFQQVTRLFRQHPHLIGQAAVWRERYAEQLAKGLAALGGGSSPTLPQRVKASVSVHTVALCADQWLRDEGVHEVADLAEVAVEAFR